jgi:hypothetical protein
MAENQSQDHSVAELAHTLLVVLVPFEQLALTGSFA